MKLNTIFAFYGVAAVISCVVYLLFPAVFITVYGANVDPQTILLFRVIGALFGGLGVMAWVGRNAERSKSRDAMVLGLAVSNGLAAILAALGVVSGVFNQFGWGPSAVCALFAIGFLLAGRSGMSTSAPN